METYLTVITLLLIAATTILLPVVRRYLSTHAHSRQVETLMRWASTLVRAAEQRTLLESNEAKYHYVMDALKRLAKDNGIELADYQLEALLEAAVNDLKVFK